MVPYLSPYKLPLLLPETDEIKPSGTGESPPANIDSFVNVVDEKTGMKGRRETNTMPQWQVVVGIIYVTSILKMKIC